ncbi:hypothetical protein [Microvirgula aerodenitrificans]|uniref:hypothetical protein n=1 Tax=Pseudomonadota TaxID=1224 RepID=UPI0028E38E6F|nr:hypothetical protein [Microvirgula aerodenitrificans]
MATALVIDNCVRAAGSASVFGEVFTAAEGGPFDEEHQRLRISANVTGDFGNVTDLGLNAGLRG